MFGATAMLPVLNRVSEVSAPIRCGQRSYSCSVGLQSVHVAATSCLRVHAFLLSTRTVFLLLRLSRSISGIIRRAALTLCCSLLARSRLSRCHRSSQPSSNPTTANPSRLHNRSSRSSLFRCRSLSGSLRPRRCSTSSWAARPSRTRPSSATSMLLRALRPSRRSRVRSPHAPALPIPCNLRLTLWVPDRPTTARSSERVCALQLIDDVLCWVRSPVFPKPCPALTCGLVCPDGTPSMRPGCNSLGVRPRSRCSSNRSLSPPRAAAICFRCAHACGRCASDMVFLIWCACMHESDAAVHPLAVVYSVLFASFLPPDPCHAAGTCWRC